MTSTPFRNLSSTTPTPATKNGGKGYLLTISLATYGALIVVIIIGNVTVIRTFCGVRRMKPNFCLILSLALADLSVGLIVIPVRLSEILQASWSLYLGYCRFSHCLTLLSLSASILNLSIITVDRYLAISRPLHYKVIVTKARAVVICICTWGAAIAISFSPVVGAGAKGGNGKKSSQGLCQFRETLNPIYLVIYASTVLLIPTVLISTLQFLIMMHVSAHFKRHQVLIRSQSQSGKSVLQRRLMLKKEIKLQRTFRTVIVLFYICWIPFACGILMTVISPVKIRPLVVFSLSVPVFANSAMSPIVYLLCNEYMRRIMLGTLLSCCRTSGADNEALRSDSATKQNQCISEKSEAKREHQQSQYQKELQPSSSATDHYGSTLTVLSETLETRL